METALMISVVNGKETLAALEGGADIIDIKNPAEGALGAPAPGTIQDVCSMLDRTKPFSVALGELPGKPGAAALAALGSGYFKPDFVKIAFLPNTSPEEMSTTLQEVRKSLSLVSDKEISLVSVAYADKLRFAQWNVDEFASIAKEAGAKGCLVDTWEKKNKSLLHYMSIKNIEHFIDSCHKRELFCGLAGSLKFSDIVILSGLEADIIGVRSAVCMGDRLNGTVSAQDVNHIKKALRKIS
ncbi:MAG: hypothetical protein GX434_05510 [Peptococcaceae bacterium]|nr:hypothetical protein [Peptococcaceae bacterium]